MAVVYAVSEFTDEKGTDWKVKIVDGSISTGDLNHAFVLGPDGFRLNYNFDNFDRVKPIVGSKVELTLFHPDDNDAVFNTLYAALDTSPEGTYRVEIYRDPDSSNETWWVGEIMPEQTIIPDSYPNAAVSITAVDGLGNLKGIDYNNDGSAYTGSNNITGHLYACLSKVHSSNFWGGGDVLCSFLEDFIGAEYKTHIGVGQNQQLQNAWVEQNTFYNLDQEGANEYFTAYDVLENLAIAFNSCVFMAQGRFWFVPLGNLQGHAAGNLNISHEIRGGGVVSYNTSTNVTFAAAFGNNSVDFEKLEGWERTSSPAFKEVKRVRNYQGDKPILYRWLSDPGTLIQDEDADRPAGQQLMVSGQMKYMTSGIAGYVFPDNLARLKLSFTLRVGDAGGTSKYLSRAVTFDADNLLILFGGDAELATYGDVSWETSSASRYEFVGPFFSITNGTSYEDGFGPGPPLTAISFSFVTPPIPADAEGTQLQIDLSAVDHEGNEVAAWVSPSNADIMGAMDVGVHVYDNENYQEFGQVDIRATNAQNARYKLAQGVTLIGDKITDSDLGTIEVYNGSTNVNSSQWTSLQSSTSSLSINGLGVRERLAANKTAKRIERGTLFQVQQSKFLHPYSILTNSDEGATYYQLTSLSFTASRCEYDIECMFLSRDVTEITLAQDNGKPSKGDPWPTVALQNKISAPIDDTILGTVNTKAANLTTDAYGITALKISDGASSTWNLTPPTSAASAGQTELMFIRDNGLIVKVANGTAGQVLTVNAGATSAYFQDAAGGESGWFNSTTLMKIMPTEFMANDDGGAAVLEDDTADKLGLRTNNRFTELYVTKAIPTGYKATHVQVYASASTSSAVTVRQFDHTDGDLTGSTTGDFNSNIDITDITSSATANIMIKCTGSTTVFIYGADITIAAV